MRLFANLAGRMTLLIGLALATLTSTSWADQPTKGPVKVFVLVGQSNMQGKASLLTLSHQIEAERTREQFAHLHDGNVAVVKTDQYWDPVAAEAYKVWAKDIDAWRHHGNDFGYHYLGSPKIIYEIGDAFGKQMLQLLGTSE